MPLGIVDLLPRYQASALLLSAPWEKRHPSRGGGDRRPDGLVLGFTEETAFSFA